MKMKHGDNSPGAVFLDRDGVLNEIVYHQDLGLLDSPFTLKQFKLMPGSARAVANINKSGLLAILISNQPGVAKKHYAIEVHQAMDRKLTSLLAKESAHLDDRFYCLDHPEARIKKYRKNSDWRKPMPGMILAATAKYSIDRERSWMIGDSIIDIQAAHAAGIKAILIGSLHCYTCRLLAEYQIRPEYAVATIEEAVALILGKYSDCQRYVPFPTEV